MPAQNEVDRVFNFKGDLTQGLFPHTRRTEGQFTKHLPSLLSLFSRGGAVPFTGQGMLAPKRCRPTLNRMQKKGQNNGLPAGSQRKFPGGAGLCHIREQKKHNFQVSPRLVNTSGTNPVTNLNLSELTHPSWM